MYQEKRPENYPLCIYEYVTFITKETYPPVTLNGLRIPQAEDAKYLGLYLDCRLNWEKRILTKRKQLGFQLRKMYWLLVA